MCTFYLGYLVPFKVDIMDRIWKYLIRQYNLNCITDGQHASPMNVDFCQQCTLQFVLGDPFINSNLLLFESRLHSIHSLNSAGSWLTGQFVDCTATISQSVNIFCNAHFQNDILIICIQLSMPYIAIYTWHQYAIYTASLSVS